MASEEGGAWAGRWGQRGETQRPTVQPRAQPAGFLDLPFTPVPRLGRVLAQRKTISQQLGPPDSVGWSNARASCWAALDLQGGVSKDEK